MKAAVVTSFDSAPQCLDRPEPVADGGSIVVDLVAAGLHPRVRSQADGSHYTSTDALPLVPGIDGVGRDAEGALRYFVLPDTDAGSMSERVLIDPRRSVVLPEDADPLAIAAGMNPAMSSWVALRRRIDFAGGTVLVTGASGNAGRMAIQVARHLGASEVFGVARSRHDLVAHLGATPIAFDDDEGIAKASDVDVVLDYVWGEPAAELIAALITAREDRGRRLDWVEIGSMGGLVAPIPSAALRASGLTLVGSGQGSVDTRDILAELPAIATALNDGTIAVNARTVPLRDVEQEWTRVPASDERVVIVP
ncbi:MAG: zinc-binding alcohol dehydrogenase family protein [Marmoricola sp.]